jgi:hypothetical protein
MHSSYAQSVHKNGSKHDLRQIMQFVYLRLTCSSLCWIWAPNMTCSNSKSRVLAHGIQPVSDEYGARNMTHSKWRNSCVGVRHAAYLWYISAGNVTRYEWWNLCIGLQYPAFCAKYVHKNWLAPRNYFVYVLWSCSQSVLNKGAKHDLKQMKKFVYSRFNYNLPFLNMASKHDSR